MSRGKAYINLKLIQFYSKHKHVKLPRNAKRMLRSNCDHIQNLKNDKFFTNQRKIQLRIGNKSCEWIKKLKEKNILLTKSWRNILFTCTVDLASFCWINRTNRKKEKKTNEIEELQNEVLELIFRHHSSDWPFFSQWAATLVFNKVEK